MINGGKIIIVINNFKGIIIDNKGIISSVKGDNFLIISGNSLSFNLLGGSLLSGGFLGGSSGGSFLLKVG